MLLRFTQLQPTVKSVESLCFLEETSKLQPPYNRPMEIQLKYCKEWCLLSKFLWNNRHKVDQLVTSEPMEFQIFFDQTTLNFEISTCYWNEVITQGFHLTRLVQDYLENTLKFAEMMLDKNPRVKIENEHCLEQYKKGFRICISTLGILTYLINEAIPNYPEIYKNHANIVHSIKLKHTNYSVMTNWFYGNIEMLNENWEMAIPSYLFCIFMIKQKEPTLANYPSNQAIARSSEIRLLLCKAELSSGNSRLQFFAQAKLYGWIPKSEEDVKTIMMTDQSKVSFVKNSIPVDFDDTEEVDYDLRNGLLDLNYESIYKLRTCPYVIEPLMIVKTSEPIEEKELEIQPLITEVKQKVILEV